MTYYLYLISFVCFAGFIWAAKRLFKVNDSTGGVGKKIISIVGLISIIIQEYLILTLNLNSINILLAAICFSISTLIFISAVLTTIKSPLHFLMSQNSSSKIITSGAYKYIRHPFYSSYILAWLGGIIASAHIGALLPLVLVPIYIFSALSEEKAFKTGHLSSQYIEYSKKTGMFFPNIYWLIKND
jgi:protein-S-isoprenylcysteine O-methyltransferase Ste14